MAMISGGHSHCKTRLMGSRCRQKASQSLNSQGGVVKPDSGRGLVVSRADGRENAKIAGRLRDARCVCW